MATLAPTHPCHICGGKLEWEVVPHHRMPGEPVRFGPTDWRQLPHQCPPGAVEKWLGGALERGNADKAKPFFTIVEPEKEKTMSAALRLKMSIGSVKSVCDHNGDKMAEEVALNAVYGPDGSANAQWSKWTPAASLTMTINNPGAFGKVLPGQFFFVDLIPTTKDAA